VRATYGEGEASTLDMSEELGSPRGFIGMRNIALERAIGGGLPLGRITEISGWEGAGKSTAADQILAQAQTEGGLGVLADTERARNREYMRKLGIMDESLIRIGGITIESMFGEMELLIREYASVNAVAWHLALKRAGAKVPKLSEYTFNVTEGRGESKKTIGKHRFAEWDRSQAAALLAFQQGTAGLSPSSIRDAATRELLRPVTVYTDATSEAAAKAEAKAHMADWLAERDNPYCQPADRPVVCVWDSVAGTPTKKELEGSAEDVHPASAAKVIRANLRRLVQLIDDEAIALILVNQRYEKLEMGGFGKKGRGGSTSETYGGGGIKYHTTIRIELQKMKGIYARAADRGNGIPPIGQIVKVRVPKNKVANPFHTEEFGLMYGRGADDAWTIFEDLKARAIIYQAGSWARFSDPSILGEEKSFQGWMGLSNLMAERPGLIDKLHKIYMEGR